MVVVPLSIAQDDLRAAPSGYEFDCPDWVRYAAAGTLAASGVMLVSGQRRAGLVTAIAGAALAMLDQREAVLDCWDALPGYLGEIQGLLAKAQAAVDEISAQNEKLHQVLGR